ncbi:MAG TPA: hypothetical protein VFW11_10495 [Cyclobacteriaceae bacterium]|nr:hypothetical protein [Cyclobacteriaceae bacterium]
MAPMVLASYAAPELIWNSSPTKATGKYCSGNDEWTGGPTFSHDEPRRRREKERTTYQIRPNDKQNIIAFMGTDVEQI